MSNTLVSVIIPVYCASEAHEKYLLEALQSIARQTLRDFEVIIVDDNSPRDISTVVASAGDLPGLKIIRNETNLRQAGSRNVGVRAAEGELLAFLDHDDIWVPNKLERQTEEFSQHPEAGMIFCAVKPFGNYANNLNIDQSKLPDNPDFEWFMRHGNYVITMSAAMVRRDVLEEIGLFDTRFTTSDDLDAWLKIVRIKPIYFVRESLVGYRLHSANANYGVDRLNDTRLLFGYYLRFFLDAPFKKKISLLKPMFRKIAGQIYFRLFRLKRQPKSKG